MQQRIPKVVRVDRLRPCFLLLMKHPPGTTISHKRDRAQIILRIMYD